MNTQRLSHIISTHIFIFATSLAMLVHSTWTFGTLFSGKQPIIDGSLENWIAYFLWVTPALLVALAIDVGQIQTSVKLSNATGRSQKVTLGITFITLALAGYYLQWFHLAHHIPALEFGSGLTPDMQENLEGLKALAIFFVPALLPLSTVLYTLSSDTGNAQPQVDSSLAFTPPLNIGFPMLEPAIWKDDTQHIHVLTGDDDTEPYLLQNEPLEDEKTQSYSMDNVTVNAQLNRLLPNDELAGSEYTSECEHCGWICDPKSSQASADRALRAHRQHCTAQHMAV